MDAILICSVIKKHFYTVIYEHSIVFYAKFLIFTAQSCLRTDNNDCITDGKTKITFQFPEAVEDQSKKRRSKMFENVDLKIPKGI